MKQVSKTVFSHLKSFSFLILEKKPCAKEADEGKVKRPSPPDPSLLLLSSLFLV